MKDDSVWLTQGQIAKLLQDNKDGELEEKSNVQKMHFSK